MRHRDAGPGEQGGERGGIDGEGIHQGNPVLPCDLDQRQIGHIRPLGVKLGVEGVALLADDVGKEGLEALLVDDHGGWSAHRWAAVPKPVLGAVVIAAGVMAECPDPFVVAIMLARTRRRRAMTGALPNLRVGLRAEAIAVASNAHPTVACASGRPSSRNAIATGRVVDVSQPRSRGVPAGRGRVRRRSSGAPFLVMGTRGVSVDVCGIRRLGPRKVEWGPQRGNGSGARTFHGATPVMTSGSGSVSGSWL